MVDLLRCALPERPDPELAERAARPFLRRAAADALAEARRDPARATPNLARWFRRARKLGARDRPVVSEAVYGVLRHEALLRRAGARDDDELVGLWTRLVAGERFEGLPSEGPERDYATALSLPLPVAAEWLRRLGPEEAAALGRALAGRAPVTVRANRLRCAREQLAERLRAEGVETRPCERAPDGLHVVGRPNLERLPSFRDGWFEVQDEASQLLAEAVPLAFPGERVLDFCAGAGGKSLALAARGARVQAHDVRRGALEELERRAWRAGARIDLGPPAPAPVVLVDAPCSGTGRLRREPALRLGLRPEARLRLQRDILARAADLVLPGGVLVYATCSLRAAENAHEPPGSGWELVEERWLWPHRGGTDGFAWRTWRRRG